jgi:PAS domain S-box-containing protein
MPDPQDFHLLGSALVKNRRCAIVYANGAGGIGFWNAGAEALFGHSAADVSGKRVDVIVPEEYRAIHWTGFNRAIGSAWRGSEAWSSIEGVHKNGSRIALEVFLTPVQEDEEVAKGVLAMFRAAA